VFFTPFSLVVSPRDLHNDIVVRRDDMGGRRKEHVLQRNTALHSTQRQPVHADAGQLWKGLQVAPPAYGLVVNVPVVDISPLNGSTELWPGTHRDTGVSVYDDIKVLPEALERRRDKSPPFSPA